MSDPGTPTFDQLRVFLTVIDVGSFAGAARQLNRATSVISYTITNLEAQLGVTLFERDSTRRPRLTDDGKALLSEARNVALGFNRLRAKAKGLHQGLEPEVHVALDMMLPASRIVEALKNFREEFPTVPLKLRAEALGAVTQLVLDRTSMIGVRGPPDVEIDGLERIGVGSVHLVPVAAPDHPLASQVNVLGAGRHHVQLVLTDRTSLTAGEDLGVMGTHTWRVADLATKHMLLREGIGWGTMPEPMVREDLACGKLVLLDLPDFKGGHYRFFAIHRTDMPPGPAASFLINQFEWQSHGMNGGTFASTDAAPTIVVDTSAPRGAVQIESRLIHGRPTSNRAMKPRTAS
ncbi:LysR family transcriptional regulator [Mesorhizobium sp. B4-1-3]|uniref:LysR family transcriptional regulator n=1 Tax=Mesorhizobium sp. B4-1-3 TaxID=2589889 RepID=UPI0011285AE5|nr:LysR family transcriptional regulator [Mesorhizobium sp. B4-1-3]TPI12972.1 LysR family transcriptional regulator [Mesorhizobium sp. B4-1-3]